MTVLLLDVGNSRLKWATASGTQLEAGGAVAHDGNPAAAVSALAPARADAVWIANVTGPALAAPLAVALAARYSVTPRFAAVQAEYAGLRAAYAEPQRLGVDRWLALLAAWSATRGGACVISAGTALTFDAVEADGRHLGGVIAPGLLAMQQAVLGVTRFPSSGPAPDYSEGLGVDTDACVRQGALHAGAGLVERLAARHSGLRWITGGDAAVLARHLGPGWTVRPQLVLEGLLAYACGQASNIAP
jgi:type III pantothenate kinase